MSPWNTRRELNLRKEIRRNDQCHPKITKEPPRRCSLHRRTDKTYTRDKRYLLLFTLAVATRSTIHITDKHTFTKLSTLAPKMSVSKRSRYERDCGRATLSIPSIRKRNRRCSYRSIDPRPFNRETVLRMDRSRIGERSTTGCVLCTVAYTCDWKSGTPQLAPTRVDW